MPTANKYCIVHIICAFQSRSRWSSTRPLISGSQFWRWMFIPKKEHSEWLFNRNVASFSVNCKGSSDTPPSNPSNPLANPQIEDG